MTAYFVTSSGTGVGKTFTTCALLMAARNQGRAARGLKPIISGWQDDSDSDTARIIAAVGNIQQVDNVSPWRFVAPLSPHRAAALEGASIDVVALEDWCKSQIMPAGLTLIEGAGGVMTPITDKYTMLDLMTALKLPVILVVGSYLGSISHTLSALEVLRARGLKVAALVISETVGSEVTLAETQAGMQPFLADIAWCIVQPRVTSTPQAKPLHAMMEKL
jgi:dethiobiotin synthetase